MPVARSRVLLLALALAAAVTGAAVFQAPSHHTERVASSAPAGEPNQPAGKQEGVVPKPAATPEPALDSDESHILARLEKRRSRVGAADLRALAQTIVREARRHAIDPDLVLAVIAVESSYHRRAVSRVGARGLMQLMPATGKALARKLELQWEGDASLFDPQLNVTLGVAYLGQLKERFGDIEKSLAAYNWGPTRIGRALRNGEALPRHYVEHVFSTYETSRRLRVSGS